MVAVKVFNDGPQYTSDSSQERLQTLQVLKQQRKTLIRQEIAVLKSCRDHNIVQFVGACIQVGPLTMLRRMPSSAYQAKYHVDCVIIIIIIVIYIVVITSGSISITIIVIIIIIIIVITTKLLLSLSLLLCNIYLFHRFPGTLLLGQKETHAASAQASHDLAFAVDFMQSL